MLVKSNGRLEMYAVHRISGTSSFGLFMTPKRCNFCSTELKLNKRCLHTFAGSDSTVRYGIGATPHPTVEHSVVLKFTSHTANPIRTSCNNWVKQIFPAFLIVPTDLNSC